MMNGMSIHHPPCRRWHELGSVLGSIEEDRTGQSVKAGSSATTPAGHETSIIPSPSSSLPSQSALSASSAEAGGGGGGGGGADTGGSGDRSTTSSGGGGGGDGGRELQLGSRVALGSERRLGTIRCGVGDKVIMVRFTKE